LVEDRHKDVTKVYTEPGSAIEGDSILVYARKPGKWMGKIRATDGHHYFRVVASKNALAVLRRKFKNLQKSPQKQSS